MVQAIPAFYINLDRRPDRRAFMEDQLRTFGVEAERISALDAETVTDAQLKGDVALSGHLIPMSRGSQCNACNHFSIMRRLVASDAPAALVLEDDIELSPEITGFLQDVVWMPEGLGIVRLEKWSRRATSKLLGPSTGRSPVRGRDICRLYSRIGGSGAYIITRDAAERILAEKKPLRHPIDHLLFNFNLSPLARQIGVALVVPALARQAWGGFSSDISGGRKAHVKSVRDRLRRGWTEIRLVPEQAAAVLFGSARLRPVEFVERTA